MRLTGNSTDVIQVSKRQFHRERIHRHLLRVVASGKKMAYLGHSLSLVRHKARSPPQCSVIRTKPLNQAMADRAPSTKQSRIDRIISATPTTSGPVVLSRGAGPGPVAPGRREKIYCDKWIHDGTCAFTQQGCKFKHEMPTDKETQMSLGLFHGFPPWWRRYCAERSMPIDDAPVHVPAAGGAAPHQGLAARRGSGGAFGAAAGAGAAAGGGALGASSWRRRIETSSSAESQASPSPFGGGGGGSSSARLARGRGSQGRTMGKSVFVSAWYYLVNILSDELRSTEEKGRSSQQPANFGPIGPPSKSDAGSDVKNKTAAVENVPSSSVSVADNLGLAHDVCAPNRRGGAPLGLNRYEALGELGETDARLDEAGVVGEELD